MFTGKEIGFTRLVYPEATGLDPNSAGYLYVFCFRNLLKKNRMY